MSVDTDILDGRVAEINRLMAGHAGAIEVVDVSDTGQVTVQFTGLCTGCPCKPLTMASTVRPGIGQLPGVSSVVAAGGRISEEAEERLLRLSTPSFTWA
jgi:Fe-S cluster biogenesis protein NfuA